MAVLSRTKGKVTNRVQPRVATRSRSRDVVDEEEGEEVETKAEAKAESVVVPKPLADMMSKWAAAEGAADLYFARIVQLVIEQEFDRSQIKSALMEYRGLAELSARSELSVIWRVKDYPNDVQKCLKGKITVRELRDKGKNKQEKTTDPEKRLPGLLKKAARFAIEEIEYEKAEFIDVCKAAYTAADAEILRDQKRASKKAEEGEDVEAPEDEEDLEDQLEEGDEDEGSEDEED